MFTYPRHKNFEILAKESFVDKFVPNVEQIETVKLFWNNVSRIRNNEIFDLFFVVRDE